MPVARVTICLDIILIYLMSNGVLKNNIASGAKTIFYKLNKHWKKNALQPKFLILFVNQFHLNMIIDNKNAGSEWHTAKLWFILSKSILRVYSTTFTWVIEYGQEN